LLPELLPQRGAKAAKIVAASRQSAANLDFEMRLSTESRYVCGKTFCVFCAFLRLFLFQ